MKTIKPDIYDYIDFRKFIAVFQQSKAEIDLNYTKSYMEKLFGLPNSRSFMSDVLRGKHISDAFTERFILYFADPAIYLVMAYPAISQYAGVLQQLLFVNLG